MSQQGGVYGYTKDHDPTLSTFLFLIFLQVLVLYPCIHLD